MGIVTNTLHQSPEPAAAGVPRLQNCSLDGYECYE